MNQVVLTGRLTRDPEKRYSASNMTITKFTIAVDRMARQGEERKADFIRIVVFDKQAENCDRYLQKGKKVAVVGRIQTGLYENQQGQRVYTTDVVANNVEFLEWGEANDRPQGFLIYDRSCTVHIVLLYRILPSPIRLTNFFPLCRRYR